MAHGVAKNMKKNKYFAALGSALLYAVYSPLAVSGRVPVDQLSSLVSIIAFALLLLGAKRVSNILPAACLYFLLYTFSASHLLGSVVILALTVASLTANELILNRGNVWKSLTVFAFIPVSLVVAYLLSGSPIAFALAVIPYFIGTLLWLGVRFKKNRKSVIILLTFGFVIIALGGLVGYMLSTGKDFIALRNTYITARDSFADWMFSYTVPMNGENVPLFTDVPLAKQIFISMSNSLPSIIVIVFIIVSYFLYNYQSAMLEKFGGYEYITEEIKEIRISAAAAAVYLIAFVFSITTDSHGGEAFGSVVCKNIYTMLTPALVYAGACSIRNFVRKKKIRAGFLLIFPLVLLAMTGYMFMILSLVGIICIFANSAREWAEKKD